MSRRMTPHEPKHRSVITESRLRRIVSEACRSRLPRVEIVSPDSWAPLGPPEVVMADVNAMLHKCSLAWTAHREGERVWIERDPK